MLQQLLYLHALYLPFLCHYKLYCRNNYYVTEALYHSNYYVSTTYIYNSYVKMIDTVSTTITQALCYSNYDVSIIYIYSSYAPGAILSQPTITPPRPYITAITMSP